MIVVSPYPFFGFYHIPYPCSCPIRVPHPCPCNIGCEAPKMLFILGHNNTYMNAKVKIV